MPLWSIEHHLNKQGCREQDRQEVFGYTEMYYNSFRCHSHKDDLSSVNTNRSLIRAECVSSELVAIDTAFFYSHYFIKSSHSHYISLRMENQ